MIIYNCTSIFTGRSLKAFIMIFMTNLTICYEIHMYRTNVLMLDEPSTQRHNFLQECSLLKRKIPFPTTTPTFAFIFQHAQYSTLSLQLKSHIYHSEFQFFFLVSLRNFFCCRKNPPLLLGIFFIPSTMHYPFISNHHLYMYHYQIFTVC